MIYLFALFCVVLAFVTRPLFLNLLIDADAIQENYQRKEIPVGMGLYLFFNLATLWSIGYIIGLYSIQRFFPILLLTGIFSFLGFIDDLLGNRKARGLIGHFGCLLKGRLTTGGLKALGAAVISLVVVYYSTDQAVEAVISWFTLLLLTNFINLLDLRPGRALKVFTVSLLALFVVYWQLGDIWYLAIPLVPLMLFYFPLDLSALAMLGDTGANLLGGILGYFLIQTVGFWGEVGILVTLMLVHLYSERYSLSVLIEENRVLGWLDRLGRE
ncbi:MAG: glycosyl transferase family 4 [Halanaerobiales bacterium]|nr:glycosyl transferase family 4 [Halanaerobiales bacterium]